MKLLRAMVAAAGLLGTGGWAADIDARLAAFDREMKVALAKEHNDDQVVKAVEALKKEMTVADLPKLEAFLANRKDSYKWAAMQLFVEFKQLDALPRLLTPILAEMPDAEARRYSMWKVWEVRFGERQDFHELSTQLGLAFANYYEKADEKERETIADLFEQKAGTPAEFRAYIEASLKKK